LWPVCGQRYPFSIRLSIRFIIRSMSTANRVLRQEEERGTVALHAVR
jgi:hypothetical protein